MTADVVNFVQGSRQENPMSYQSINLKQKFGLFSEQWQPRVIAEITLVQNRS
jgi:hypothetical protein